MQQFGVRIPQLTARRGSYIPVHTLPVTAPVRPSDWFRNKNRENFQEALSRNTLSRRVVGGYKCESRAGARAIDLFIAVILRVDEL